MFWIILLSMTVLVGMAFDWISFYVSRERIVITINIGRLTPTLRKFKEAMLGQSPQNDALP
jgi:hypothetical protein